MSTWVLGVVVKSMLIESRIDLDYNSFKATKMLLRHQFLMRLVTLQHHITLSCEFLHFLLFTSGFCFFFVRNVDIGNNANKWYISLYIFICIIIIAKIFIYIVTNYQCPSFAVQFNFSGIICKCTTNSLSELLHFTFNYFFRDIKHLSFSKYQDIPTRDIAPNLNGCIKGRTGLSNK